MFVHRRSEQRVKERAGRLFQQPSLRSPLGEDVTICECFWLWLWLWFAPSVWRCGSSNLARTAQFTDKGSDGNEWRRASAGRRQPVELDTRLGQDDQGSPVQAVHRPRSV